MASCMTAWISRLSLVVGLALGLAFHMAPVSADVLDFDAVPTASGICDASTSTTSFVGLYGGLIWSSVSGGFGSDVVGLECNANYTSPFGFGNPYSAPSSPFAAYNSQGFGEILITPVSGTFDFLGASFSSFASAGTFETYSAYSLRLEGYYLGNLVSFAEFDLSSTGYFSFVSSFGTFTGLDALGIFAGNLPISFAGDGLYFGGDGQYFLVDDVSVTLNVAPIPEPGTVLLLGAGLVAMAWNRKRRRA